MGDEPRQGGLIEAGQLVIFLDENHCRNQKLIAALEARSIACEKHLDHFPAGTEDVVWLPEIGRRSWCLLTSDARIRWNHLEKEAVRTNGVRMFYFTSNNLSGQEMSEALARALPAITSISQQQPAPFIASISKSGSVTVRETFNHPE